jgi:hypothetical protein
MEARQRSPGTALAQAVFAVMVLTVSLPFSAVAGTYGGSSYGGGNYDIGKAPVISSISAGSPGLTFATLPLGNGPPLGSIGGSGIRGSIIPTTTASAATSSAIVTSGNAALIAQLQTQVKRLFVQLTALTGRTNTAGSGTFTRDLAVGSTGADVKALQIYLNAHGFLVAKSGPGSPGNETTKFGAATKAALAKWQVSVGVSPTSGYFGPKSRALISAAWK